ncbi:MAG: hypothetical protein HY453_01650 [Parcubacteria group bacterium]|nr:hypothetical protein [Parcubacteria group bacterium]
MKKTFQYLKKGQYVLYTAILAGGFMIFVIAPVGAQIDDDQGFAVRPIFLERMAGKDFRGFHGGLGMHKRGDHTAWGKFFEKRKEKIEKLLMDGKITPEEAQKRLDKLESINTLRLTMHAEMLGMTLNELKKEMEAGKSFLDLVKEKGINMEEVHQKMRELKRSRSQEFKK